jgi:hypothetical protein
VVDPVLGQESDQQTYLNSARTQRDQLAYRYLNDWNNETMVVFDNYAKMSQFGNLWRIFTLINRTKMNKQSFGAIF